MEAMVCRTPAEIENDFKARGRRPSAVEVECLYAVRDEWVGRLATQGAIEVDDLEKLDRLGRFRVADELWGKCSAAAQSRLLDDPHHFVRSVAFLSDFASNSLGNRGGVIA